MENVNLVSLTMGKIGDKKKLQSIADFILKLSPSLYKKIVAYMMVRKTKKLLTLIGTISLFENPDIIHSLRTQPEGILAERLSLKYKNAKFCLTTWGQDFILWAETNSWLNIKSKDVLKKTDYIFPDNYRDDDIIKKKYGLKNKKTLVVPATGGIDIDFMDKLKIPKVFPLKGKINFLSTRGYDNTYVKLTELLLVYKRIVKDYPDTHFYIDLHKNIQLNKDIKIQSWIDENKLTNKITLLHLTREEMFTYMSKCRFHVSATLSDGMPLSLLESLYFGQTPIVFNHASTEILETQFSNYFSFSSYKISEIENCWRNALEAGSQKQEIIKLKNLEIIMKYYKRRSNIEKIVNIYQELIHQ